MQKRGQVSIFAIIGIIVIFAIVFLFLLFRGFEDKARQITNPREFLRVQMDDIKKVVNKCVGDESRGALDLLFYGGGRVNPIRYANYYDQKVNFLCFKIEEGENCYNAMFSTQDIDKELRPVLNREILSCVDDGLQVFTTKEDYILETGEFSLDFDFSDEVLLVTVDYPITLTKGNINESVRDFRRSIETDFWGMAERVSFIVNQEALGNPINVAKLSSEDVYYEIIRRDSGAGNLYVISPRYNPQGDPNFYFAVEK